MSPSENHPGGLDMPYCSSMSIASQHFSVLLMVREGFDEAKYDVRSESGGGSVLPEYLGSWLGQFEAFRP